MLSFLLRIIRAFTADRSVGWTWVYLRGQPECLVLRRAGYRSFVFELSPRTQRGPAQYDAVTSN